MRMLVQPWLDLVYLMRDCDPVSYTAIVSIVLACAAGDSDHSRGRVEICCDAALVIAR
jgi:hypothetical protein